MSELAAKFLEHAVAHMHSAKHHGNAQVRYYEYEMATITVANVLYCRNLTRTYRLSIAHMLNQFIQEYHNLERTRKEAKS